MYAHSHQNLMHYRDISKKVAFHKNQRTILFELTIWENGQGNVLNHSLKAYSWRLRGCAGYDSLFILAPQSWMADRHMQDGH